MMKTRKRLSLKIPPGVESGSRLRLTGKGEGGTRGGPAGDLYIVLHVQPHSLFQRQGDDLFCDIIIPLGIAILGGEIPVPTLDGSAKTRIMPGTESGKIFRLRGKGAPVLGGGSERGDLHARIITEIPKNLSSSQKKLFSEFLDSCRESNYPESRESEQRAAKFLENRKKQAATGH